MTEAKKQRKRRTGFKKAPPGYYTAAQAIKILGMPPATFYYHVKTGAISKVIPPLRREGYYPKEEIDQLAHQVALIFQTVVEEKTGTEVHVARAEDAQGIYDVLDSMGWRTAPVKLRLSWYQVNPYIDYVVTSHKQVVGYITAVPYTPHALRDIMSGRKRAWDMQPDDILPYEKGMYDLYVGIATRQDIDRHKMLAYRLISGFITFLEELAEQGIILHRMYAVSAEKDGQEFCRHLGFVEIPNQEDDIVAFTEGKTLIRFMLDLETSTSLFAKQYRNTWKK